MIQSRHTLDYCTGCKTNIVRCATCNNNSCNAGYGEVDGKQCTDCPEAYEHQDAYWKDNQSVTFTKVTEEAAKDRYFERVEDAANWVVEVSEEGGAFNDSDRLRAAIGQLKRMLSLRQL